MDLLEVDGSWTGLNWLRLGIRGELLSMR